MPPKTKVPKPPVSRKRKDAGKKALGNPPYYDQLPGKGAREPWDPDDPPSYSPPESVPEAEVYWEELAPGPGWAPYIIYCVSFVDPILMFKFQKQGGLWGDTTHTINVNETSLVWRHSPSTLSHKKGPITGGEAAFLFLTDLLETVAPALWMDGHRDADGSTAREGPGTGGGGKWPSRAGERVKIFRAFDEWMNSEERTPADKRVAGQILKLIGDALE